MTLPRQNILLARQASAKTEAEKQAEATRIANLNPINRPDQIRKSQDKAQLEATLSFYQQEQERLREEIRRTEEETARKRAEYRAAREQNPNLSARVEYQIGRQGKSKIGQLKTQIKAARSRELLARDQLKTVNRAINLGRPIAEEIGRRNINESRANLEQRQRENVRTTIINRFGTEVGGEILKNPEATRTAYSQLTNRDFKPTPNTARRTDIRNVRQQAFETTRADIEASGATNAGEYFASVRARSSSPIGAAETTNITVEQPLYSSTDTINRRPVLEPTVTPVNDTQTVYSSTISANPNPQPSGFTGAFKQGFFFNYRIDAQDTTNDLNRNRGGSELAGGLLGTTAGIGSLFVSGAGVLKVVSLGNKGYKAFQAGRFYQGLTTGGRAAVNTGAFLSSQAAIATGTAKTSEFLETGKLKDDLRGYDITPEEFRGVVSTAIYDSQKEGFFNRFGYQVSTRFGDDPAKYEASLNEQLKARGLTEAQITALKPVADRTRRTREIAEGFGLVTGAAATELFGRAAFSASNRLVNKVFTGRVLREGTIKGGTAAFSASPLAQAAFKPTLTQARTLGTTATTKGFSLFAAGFGEGAGQEFLTQQTRGTKDKFGTTTYKIAGKNVRVPGRITEIGKQGYYGGVAASSLGVPIASSLELGRIGTSKGVNTFANIADPFEYPGDVLADVATEGGRLSYRVPTVTATGTASTPTYQVGDTASIRTNEYFYGKNKAQDTFSSRSTTEFKITSQTPGTEKPAPIRQTVSTPTPAALPSFSSIGTQTTASDTPAPVPLPEPSPAPVSALSNTFTPSPVPAPAPAPVTNPVTAPVTAPVSAPVTQPSPVPVPVPVVTPTPREAGFLAVGGAFAFGKAPKTKRKRLFKYTPSAYSLLTGFSGAKPSKLAIKTGFSVRPITTGKKSKKKSDIDELLKLGKRKSGKRKRKRSGFGAF